MKNNNSTSRCLLNSANAVATPTHSSGNIRGRSLRLVVCLIMAGVLGAIVCADKSAPAASFTSTQSGSWGAAATWGGAGVPGCGDTVTISSGHTVTESGSNCSGDLTVNGTLDMANNFFFFQGTTFTNNGTVLSSIGTFGEFDFRGVGGASGTTQTIAGTGVYAPSLLPVDIQIQNNTTVTPAAGTVITGVRTIGVGSGSTLSLTNALTVNNTGMSVVSGGQVIGSSNLIGQGASSVNSSGTITATLEVSTGTTTVNGNFAAITVDSGATLLEVADTTAKGNVTISPGGTFDTHNRFFLFQGTTFTNNGTIISSIPTFGEIDFRGVNGATGTTQTIAGTGVYAPAGSLPVDIQIQNNTTVTPAAGTVLSGVRTLGVASGSTLSLTNALTVNNTGMSVFFGGQAIGSSNLITQGTSSITSSGTFTAPLEVNTGTTSVSGNGNFSFAAITVDSGGATLLLAVDTTTNGNVTIGSGSTFDTNNRFFNFQGTTFTNNGTIKSGTSVFGEIDFKGVGGASATTQHVAGSGSIVSTPFPVVERVQNNTTVVLDTDFEFSNLTVDSGTLNINSKTLSLSGAFLTGSVPITVTGTINTTGSTIQYSGTAAQTVQTNLNGASYNNLTINNALGVNLPAATSVPGTLTLTNGVFTIGANLTMGNGALIRRSDGSLSGTPTFGATVNDEYFGANAIATGTELPATTTVLNNLTMNNSNTVTLSNARTANGTLFLNSGAFSNGANLTMANGATIQRDNGTLGSAPTFSSSVHVNYAGTPGVTTGPEIPSAATVLNNLTINKSGGVNLGAGGATVNGTLGLTGGTLAVGANTLVINNGATVGTGTLTSGVTGTVNYNQSSNGQSVFAGSYGNLIFSNFNKVLPAATINIAGTFTTATAVGHTITGNTINFNGAGSQTIPAFSYNNLTSSNSGARTLQSSGTIRVASVFTPGGSSYTVTGSTVEYNGSVAQTLATSFTPYNNLTINNPAGVNGSGVAGLTVNGLLRVQAGTFTSASTYNVVQIDNGATLAATSSSTINVAGNWTNNGSFTASTGTINLNGSAGQVINGSSATVFNNLTINNAAGATLSSAATVNGTLILTAGAFTNGANLTMGNGATIRRDAGSLSAAPTFGASAHVEYLGTVAVTTGPEIPVSATVLSNLTDNKAGTVTLGSGATVNGTLALNSGTLAVGTNTLTINNGTSIATGTLTSAATGTVNYNQQSNGQSVLAFDYGNLTFSNFNKTLPSSSTVKIAGTFTTGAAGGHTVTSSAVEYNGASAQTMPSGFTTYNNLTLNNAAGVTGFSGLIVQNLMRVQAGTFTSSSTYNNVQIDGGATLAAAAGSTINVGGNWTNNGSFTANNGTVNYNGSAAQSVGGSSATTFNNLTINNSNGVNLSADATVGSALTLTSGAFGVGVRTLTLNGSSTAASGTLTSGATGTVNYNQSSNGQNVLAGNYGNLTFSSFNKVLASSGTIAIASTFTPGSGAGHTITGSTVSFNGGGAQSAPASFATYNNLVINNPAGVTLGGSVAVNGALTLTSGVLGVGINTLTLNGATTASSGSFTSGATGTVNYNQSSNGQSVLGGSYGNLTLSNFNKVLPSAGSVRIAGTFTTGAGGGHTISGSTVEFNGASAQSMPSGFTTYNNLTLNNPAGVTGFAGLIVQALLRVQAGTFTTSSSFRDVQIDAGATLAAVAASTINISGNWTNNGTFTAATGGVIFNGSAAQSLGGSSVTTFNDLTISSSAAVTMGASETVGGAFTRTSGSLSIGANTLTLNGAINVTTGLNGGATSNLVIGGSGASATLPAMLLNNMTMNRAAGITLGGGLDVNGTLTLTSGNITASAVNLLTIGGSGAITRTSGYVLGDLKKTVASTGTFTFHVGTANGYSPVNANISAGAGSLTVKAVQGPQPNVVVPARALQRYWTLTGAGLTTDLTFNYLDPTDIPVTANESIFHLFKYNGTFTDMGAAGLDAANNRYTITGVSSFSDWTLAEQNAPTEITLEDFNASPVVAEDGRDAGTLLRWRTGTEVSNLGFHIHREEGGKLNRATPDLIAGSALFAGVDTMLTSGRSYSWLDTKPRGSGTRYWLEEIDLAGNSKLHGPVAGDARNQIARKSLAGQADSAVLNDVGKQSSGSVDSDRSAPLEVKAGIPTREPSTVSAEALLTTGTTVKLAVTHEGWYRITQPELLADGVESKIDPRALQLFADGIEQPIKVTGEDDGTFDSADSVEFYGIGIDSPYSASRSYFLVAGDKPGRRIAEVEGRAERPAGRGFPYTVERRDRTIYFSSLRNGERENFFGAVVSRGGVDQTLALKRILQETGTNPELEVALQGVTAGPHVVRVQVNGAEVERVSFSGQEQGVKKITLAESLLREGPNVVTLAALTGDGDVSLVDYLRLTYHRAYAADNDRLVVTAAANEQVTIDGFTGDRIRVIDVTNAGEPVELKAKVDRAKGSTYTAVVRVAGEGQRRLLAFTDGRAESIAASVRQPSNWRRYRRGADYIILTRRELIESLKPLAALRESQGLSVAVIDVEDLYNEFSYGQKTPQAIKDFLALTQRRWKKPPRYVLFAGDASYDGKNYLGFGDFDLVPTKLIDTAYLETASDDWFADFNGDGIAEIATGRLPARTVEELSRMVAKIVNYEQAGNSDEVLLVADANDGFDFEQATTELRSLIPTSLRITQVNRGRLDSEAAKRSLLEALSRKQLLVSYAGHGSVNQWRGNLLTNDDARALHNDHLSLFVMMTCLNGYFQDPALDSLAESLMKAEAGGAVAVWGSTGLTLPDGQAVLNQEFYRSIFSSGKAGPMTLGDAILRAKAAVSDTDIRRTWVLLGDPAMRLR